ncbi:MAG: branched-chain amino acid ABC transporter permease [Candidatus Rokubacteria bacterium 13_2_20CM_69_15_2]|nr:MAG: branched-chain amino acid ABC transporter permease [Candidatus Rokubacteria bacterium 13_2_20CM_69_15_2]
MAFFFDLFVNGLMIGSMYALVALGFVLIYKATSVVNFAQGELVMFGGYIAAALVSLYHLPLAVALPVLLGTMVGLGFVLERGVLRPMVGQAVISVVMVTIGLAQVFQGAAAMLWGAQTKNIPLPIPLEPYVIWEIYVSPINLLAALISGAFLVAFAWFFRRSRMGIAMRAVANDQQAAMAVGINVRLVFALSWAIAGLTAAIGGVMWGSMLGVDTQLALIGLKVFPAVILGGLDSVPGAVVGGLIIGGVESVAAGYVDPYVGGGTKDFLPYVLMILALMIRPYGFFGREIIERV